jgi:hypothetical protein
MAIAITAIVVTSMAIMIADADRKHGNDLRAGSPGAEMMEDWV